MIGRLLSSSSRVLGGTRCFSLKDSYRVGFDKCSVFKANCSLNTINLVKRLERREFQTGVVDSYRVQEKQSFSSLQKHLKPDGLTGSERRRKLVKDAKNQRFVAKPVNKNTRGFVPSRFKLTPIPSDATTTYSNARNDNKDYESFSGKLKFKEREKKRKEKRGAKEVGTSNGVKDVTKFDMADLDTMDNLQAQIQEATFDNLGLRPEVSEAVKQLFPTLEPGQLKPTEIQALAIPEILQKKHSHVLCAAETGSGKTLAYLLTIVNQLKEQEVNAPKLVTRVEVDKPKLKRNVDFGEDSADPFLNGTVPTLPTDSITPSATSSPVLESPELRLLTTSSVRKLNRPRAIVLVPSCVLASQVYSVAKKLSHFAKFRVVLVNRDTVRKHLNRRLQTPVDLLITTPNSLLNHVKNDLISLSEVNQLTIDEADTLFEKGFGEEVKSIIKSLQSTNSQLRRQYQLTVVSATLPKMVLQLLDREFPDLVRITTPSLHKSISRCKQHFVDLKDYKGNRSLGLLDTLRQFEQRTSVTNQKKEKDRILIFCNTRKAVTIVQAFLSERSIPTLSFYGGDPYKNHPPASPQQIHQFLYPDSDTSNVYDFSHPDRISTSDPQTTPLEETDPTEDPSLDDTTEPAPSTTPSLNVNGAKILICTDLASRGLDTTAVNHVIMYDFPTAVVDYLHRCGRTARAGQSGIVTSLVGKRDRALAERIRRSVRTRSVLA